MEMRLWTEQNITNKQDKDLVTQNWMQILFIWQSSYDMANRRAIASNVDWQVDKKSNSDRAKYLFETSLYCDCEFLVGNEEEKEV